MRGFQMKNAEVGKRLYTRYRLVGITASADGPAIETWRSAPRADAFP